MKCVQVPLKDAEEARKDLLRKKAMDLSHSVCSDSSFVYFPVLRSVKGYTLVERDFDSRYELSLESLLKKELGEELFSFLPHAYDIIGSILILDLDGRLVSFEKKIADAFLSLHKHITTVVKKSGERAGEYRLQEYVYLSGKHSFETEHKESGLRFRLDIRTTYFSPRLSTERLRIASFVKNGEKILVLLSGVAPFPLVLSKHSLAKEIVCVELNPDACKYAEENIQLNKIKNVVSFCDDAHRFLHSYQGSFDRVLLPAPSLAFSFLEDIKNVLHKRSVVHYYDFSTQEGIKDILKKITVVFPSAKILGSTFCGQYRPYTYRICVDFQV